MARWILGLIVAAGFVPQETAKSGVVVVRAGRIHTVSGAVIENGSILIENGRIVEVRKTTEIPAGARVIDASTQTVIPGLIDSMTVDEDLDSERTVAPDVQAIDGYDFFKKNHRQLRGGVTTVLLSPGSQRLLSGQCAIVKTGGADRDGRTLRNSFGLRVTLGNASKNPPPIYTPPIPPSADSPIRPVKQQYPTSRMGHFAELRRAFAALADPKSDLGRASKAALQEAMDQRRPLLVSARTADDLIKTILFAGEAGVRLILLDGEEADQVSDLLIEKKIPVWVNATLTPGRRQEGDDDRPSAEYERSPEIIQRLLKKGVTVALQSPETNPTDLLLLASYACRTGLTPDQALRCVTLSAAELLGIENRVGSIEKGKDADLVFLAGPPLSSGSTVQRVMIAGEFVFERKPGDDQTYDVATRSRSFDKTKTLAIRGAKLLTVTQGIIPDGLIVIEDGKISYAGKMRTLPAGITVIDGAGMTATPGMIDVHTHLGFHVDATENAVRTSQVRAAAPGNTVIPPSELIRLDDPAFRDAAVAGITGVLIAPETSGICSLVKPGGGDKKASVLREVAALKIQVSGGAAGYTAIKDQLTRGRKYHEEWEAHERSLKEAKDAPKPPPGPAPAPGPAKPADPITGIWKGTADIPDVEAPIDFTMDLKLAGTAVTGTLRAEAFGATFSQEFKGTFLNSEFKIDQEVQGARVIFSGLVVADSMRGKLEVKSQGVNFVGTAQAKREVGAAKAAPGPTTEKKEPRKDDSLEPYRKLLRREIPALVVAQDISAIENAANAFGKDNDLDWVLVANRDADYALAKIRGAIFGPDFIRERRGTEANLAEALASSGVTVALSSSSVSGSRHLPLNVVHAVRMGLDPDDGLKSVTISPARLLKLDDNLGSLERGRDGDVVLFSGDPFDLSTRIRVVVSNGKVVHQSP